MPDDHRSDPHIIADQVSLRRVYKTLLCQSRLNGFDWILLVAAATESSTRQAEQGQGSSNVIQRVLGTIALFVVAAGLIALSVVNRHSVLLSERPIPIST